MELQMTTPPPDDTQHASTYLALLYDVAPLIIAAFLIGVFRGWAGIKRSYLHESFWWTLGNIVLSSAVMSALAVGLVLALPVFGHEIPPAGELGIVLLMSSMGMKGTDKLMEYLAKATRIDPSNRESLERVKSGMTLEQQHQKNCGVPLTLKRLGEAVYSPRLPDKGSWMQYDLSVPASSYVGDDLALLMRTDTE